MNSFVLGPETANLTVGQFLSQASPGGLEVRNERGDVVAFVLSPADYEAFTYAEAERDFEIHRPEVEAAMTRRGGVTTAELLRKAAEASPNAKP
jgi:hypothetical protein